MSQARTAKVVEEEEPPKPDLSFDTVSESGDFSMYFDKGIAGLSFLKELGVEISAKGSISTLFADDIATEATIPSRRLQAAATETQSATVPAPSSGFNLGNYMAFELRRGGEDSAEAVDLAFDVLVGGIDEEKLQF